MSARKKRTGGRKAEPKDVVTAPAVPIHRLWLLLAIGLWVFVAASLLGYDPADPPGHAVAPVNEGIANWCGPVGAATAHYLRSLLGFGVWVLMAGAGLAVGLTIAGRRVSQPILRTIGVVLLTIATSGLQALIAPDTGGLPEGSGGLVAIAGVSRLSASFNTFGAGLWIILIGVIGAIVAFDRWLVIGPRRTLQFMLPALAAGQTRAQDYMAARAEAREARQVRANDVDDDTRPKRAILKNRRNAERIETPEEIDDIPEEEEVAVTVRARKPKRKKEAAPEPTPEPPVEEKQVFDEAQLREKIAKLPVRFTNAEHRTATEEDLADLQNQTSLEGYKFPALDLLEDPEQSFSAEMEEFVRSQAKALEEALRVYRIDGEVVGIDSGPVITLYEVRLAPGTKVSALNAISSDVARALKAINIRIVPNTAGRDTVGVEVPNAKKEKVRLKELMSCSEGDVSRMALPMFLGKDASGEPLIEDLASMPHMLIAGTTGSGKSVCMNTIIMSFLYTKKPNELKLVLIDPKMVELSMFRDIPHLMCPVVTEMAKAAAILEWAVQKMDERYELLAEAGVRDIAGYNALEWEELKERFNPQTEIEEAKIPRKLPYIVFMIDELADLMMTQKEVEGAIVRVAQKARAVGMHLILATQRPQANVVTGLIKSNMPGRIAFKVASGMDSRIVLDQKGGELLLGQGDMLFLSPRSHKLTRAQGTLVEDREARRIVRFLKDIAAPSFERQLVQIRGGDPEAGHDGLANAQEDPLFDKAVEIVLETKRGSVSLLQRRLAIGYTRASRLIDLMGEAGIIGEYKGTVAREVSITREMWEAMKAQAELDSRQGDAEPEASVATEQAAEDATLFPEPKAPVVASADEDASFGSSLEIEMPTDEAEAIEEEEDVVVDALGEAEDYAEEEAEDEADDDADEVDEYEDEDGDEEEYEEEDVVEEVVDEDEGEEEEDDAEYEEVDGEAGDEDDEDAEYEYEYEYVDEEGDDEEWEEEDEWEEGDEEDAESDDAKEAPARRRAS